MYLLLWIFFVYAFLGWCTEVSFAALTSGRFVNRGFLNGPVCPIYGVGVVIVLFFLDPLRGNTFLLFLGSVLLTSLLEWVTGFVLEKSSISAGGTTPMSPLIWEDISACVSLLPGVWLVCLWWRSSIPPFSG